MSTLRYLDMLYERGDMEKSQFFKKNLARVMNKLPKVSKHDGGREKCVYVCVMGGACAYVKGAVCILLP